MTASRRDTIRAEQARARGLTVGQTATALRLPLDDVLTVWADMDAAEQAPAPLAPCGTRAGAQRHRKHGEPVDPACATAERRYDAARIRRRRWQARHETARVAS